MDIKCCRKSEYECEERNKKKKIVWYFEMQIFVGDLVCYEHDWAV